MALPDNLVPSPLRTYVLDTLPGAEITIASKTSWDVLDYTFRLTGWLNQSNDFITSVACVPTAGSSGVSVVWVKTDDANIFLMLEGGTPGQSGNLLLSFTTAQGRVVNIPLAVPVTSPYATSSSGSTTSAAFAVNPVTVSGGQVVSTGSTIYADSIRVSQGGVITPIA